MTFAVAVQVSLVDKLIKKIEKEIREIWRQDEEIEVRFPIFLRIGRINKN